MFSKRSFISFLICALIAFSSSVTFAAEKENSLAKFSKILPDNIGDFRKTTKDILETDVAAKENAITTKEINLRAFFRREYETKDKSLIKATVYETDNDDAAYSLLTFLLFSKELSDNQASKCTIGTACFQLKNAISFVKGQTVVQIDSANIDAASNLATLIGENLDEGEAEVPALIKHLPNWEQVQEKTLYTLSFNAFKSAIIAHNSDSSNPPPVIDAVPFDNGTLAVIANYGGQGRLVIIEHLTPQIASDADARIQQKINELKSYRQPIPSAFKRVGNYSVFVFDAPDEATANNLINGIKYEKTVQWLYGDPFANDRANRRYLMVAGGVIITVLKTSGLALLACFLIGGFFGGFVFIRRRKQQATRDAYTDAGGMMRLNLDQLTPQTNPAKLLKSGEE